MRDGKTLTEADCYPHEIEVMSNLGYTPEDIRSVERIVGKNIISIKKSPFIEHFFVGTEASRDMSMVSGGGRQPQIIEKQWLGCYLKGSDPAIQCNLIMDARSNDVILECVPVKKVTLKGINAKPVEKRTDDDLRELYTKQAVGSSYSIEKTSVIKSVFSTPTGMGCLFKKPKVRAELLLRRGNVLLGFMQPDQVLQIQPN